MIAQFKLYVHRMKLRVGMTKTSECFRRMPITRPVQFVNIKTKKRNIHIAFELMKSERSHYLEVNLEELGQQKLITGSDMISMTK